MMDQANTGWGMTVSRRFDTDSEARAAADSLRQAGFLEEEIRIWQQQGSPLSSNEDSMARVIEGVLAGGVIAGLAGFFLTIAVTWAGNERVDEELAAIGALIGAVAGAIIVGLAVPIFSRKVAFSHPHHEHMTPGTVVTVTVGDREAQARETFAKMG